MQSFNLKIITTEGVHFEGAVEAITVRTVAGDVSVWANHSDYVTALGIGKASITVNGEKRLAACSQGVLTVIKGDVTVLASTFEWQDQIDEERANLALEQAKKVIAENADEKAVQRAKVKVQRSLTRLEVKKM